MRRRIIDVGRIKRLPSRRARPTEVPANNTLLHVKLFCGWSVVVLLDILVGFRLEYLYPAFMFVRSILDSYKYQGLVFSLLFIVLVIYLDMLCWTMLMAPWLFLIASSCVWLEMIRQWDHIFGYSSILLWMFFLYVEISQRMQTMSPTVVSFSRPFAAHCIGYPVITMSFLVKHHLLHVFRQRQQRLVAEENAQCFQILLKALPPALEEECGGDDSDRSSTVALEDVSGDNNSTSNNRTKGNRKKDPTNKLASGKERKHSGRGHNGISSAPTKRDPSPSCKSLDTSSSKSPGLSAPPTSIGSGVNNNNRTSQRTSEEPCTGHTPLSGACNGDVVRPPPANKGGQPPSGKKQAMVKAVPRTDLQQQSEAREKASKSNDLLLLELKEERQHRSSLEQDLAKHLKDIKRLHADLHATRLQEEEASQRIGVLVQQDRLSRLEIQRMRNESENMQHRLSKMSSTKSRDMESISSLEEQLRGELTTRQRLESQLREQRSQASSQNQWSKEEVKEMRDKLNKKEKEMASLKDTIHHLQSKYRDAHAKLTLSKQEHAQTEEKCCHLEGSLSDVTRVKIELFSYLSDATRKQEALIAEVAKKNAEIESLKQRMQHLVAMQSTWTPSLHH